MKTKILTVLVVIAALAVPASSRATLIGDTIDASGNGLSPGSATIGAGVEFTSNFGDLSFDFGASTLTVTSLGLTGEGGIGLFVFSGFDETITGVSIQSNSGWNAGDTILTPQFDAHSITLDMGNNTMALNAPLVFNIQTSSGVPDTGGTIELFGIGLMGLIAARRGFRAVG
jgi:hypothetical protein